MVAVYYAQIACQAISYKWNAHLSHCYPLIRRRYGMKTDMKSRLPLAQAVVVVADDFFGLFFDCGPVDRDDRSNDSGNAEEDCPY